ncbi:MAG: TRAP transporter small permease subunit [Synergistaceae bacterium]|jgi:TRAP-type C4-dicarboxylate transport system permease small subunit|nr:TRAP transporter small permease subunit [Synergistaceae bacterium]
MTAFLKKLDTWTRKLLRFLTITLFSALGLLMSLNVALRLTNDFSGYLARKGFGGASVFVKSLIPMVSFHWFDEIVELCFASLVFYGAAVLWITKGHFSVGDWITSRLPGERSRNLYKMLISLICAAFMAVFFWFSLRLTMRTSELTTVFQIPKALLYSCMPVSSFIMLAYSLADIYRDVKRLSDD